MAGLNTYVAELSPGEGEALRKTLEAAGYEFREVPHARFGAKGEGVNVVLYKSGRLVVQGKGLQDFRDLRLSDVIATEEPRLKRPTIGADETGKGDYFGPLVVAACALTPDLERFLDRTSLKDSKLLGDPQALAAAKEIDAVAKSEIIAIGPKRYNELYEGFGNLNTLLAWAHARAILEVVKKSDIHYVVLDRFCDERVVRRALGEEGRSLELVVRPRAEDDPAVAAASVLARAAFLKALARLGDQVGHPLPKGAGSPVLKAARSLVSRDGRHVLGRVAKLHFKTTQQVVSPRA